MKVTIVGGGNVGTQLAVLCANYGHEVWIYTSKPEQFVHHLSIIDDMNQVTCTGNIAGATGDDEQAFRSTNLVLITLPAFCMKNIADKISGYAWDGMKIGLIPGTGGGECTFHSCMDKGAVIFGIQRVPSVARLVEYGKKVCAVGYRDRLYLAAIPCDKTEDCCMIMHDILDMPVEALPNYLCVTMTPSNPILHTIRLKTLFEEYRPGVIYPRIPLFYEEWSDDSSELLFRCDDEVQNICLSLSEFDLSMVKSLKIHYESDTPEQLTNKIRSIKSFQGLATPSVKKEGGWIPDLESRYFRADFPYGLEILKQIADMAEVETPAITDTLMWYYALTGQKEHYQYSDYGIVDRESFRRFYLQ